MKLRYMLMSMALATASLSYAQGLKVYTTNGEITEFQAADVEKIVFYDDTQMEDDGAVDLGLSVKWASCNLGAATPAEYGDYYAWAELAPKEEYSWATYRYANGDIYSITKYNNDENYGVVDGISHMEATDDVATATLGEDWHIPSRAEWQELRDKCEWTWDAEAVGYTVTGPNGNSIFLPANGYNDSTRGGLRMVGEYGYYVTSDVNEQYWYYEDCYAFYAPDEEWELPAEHYFFYCHRAEGLGVRPVKVIEK